MRSWRKNAGESIPRKFGCGGNSAKVFPYAGINSHLVEKQEANYLLPRYGRVLAAANISWERARTRISSVKFSHRTVPEESTRNSAGREMSCFSGPPPTCKRWY